MYSGSKRRLAAIALLAASLAALVACSESAIAPPRTTPSVDGMANLGAYIVDVDLRSGRVVGHAVGSGSVNAPVDARFYGAAGSILHHFSLVGGAPSAGNTYTLEDRIENQFAFAIGTNGPRTIGSSPPDTLGVYVYISLAPTNIAGCVAGPACLVLTDSGADGAYPFTSPIAQPYMYFKTVLEAADGTAGKGLDYTDQGPANGGAGIDYARSLSFRASPAVTSFSFGVSVSAALLRPNDTRWKVSFIGDSLPNRVGTSLADLRSDPDWRFHGSAGAVTDTSNLTTSCATGTARCFRITSATPVSGTTPADTLLYFRTDSLGSTENAYMAAVVSVANLQDNAPSVFFGMQDRVKLISFCMEANHIGLCNASHAFLVGGSAALNTSVLQNWRVSKFGADSVVLYSTLGRVKVFTYASLPAAPAASASNPTFWFGNRAFFASPNPTGVVSRWSSVVYEIGATGP